jgi:hypothetical protein
METFTSRAKAMSPAENVDYEFEMVILTMRVYCDRQILPELLRDVRALKERAVLAAIPDVRPA